MSCFNFFKKNKQYISLTTDAKTSARTPETRKSMNTVYTNSLNDNINNVNAFFNSDDLTV